jgi:hypothetical protein
MKQLPAAVAHLPAGMLGAIGLAKIKVVAVAAAERRRGIGAALLRRCRQVYVHCGYLPTTRRVSATQASVR